MDEFTSKDIDERVKRILREIGVKEPPLNLENVLSFLDLHRGYYDLQNPNLIQNVTHRLKIGSFKIKDILGKINLRGLWYPDEKKILIDNNVPELKKRWVISHEIGHKMVPWHKDFIFADIAETLDPDYREQLEAEANYAASSLLFLSSRFTEEAVDYTPSLESVQKLSKIYGNTQTMTLRRFVQFSQDIPMIAVVSKPHWKSNFMNYSNDELCRYFLPSEKFTKKFGNISKFEVIEKIKSYTLQRKGGPIGTGEVIFSDSNGEEHSFEGESFFNTFDVLTLIKYKKKVAITC